MKPSEPQMRRLVFFCIREKPGKKVKQSKSSLLRGVNQCLESIKAREKKARSKRCVISRAGIDDRFTARWLDRSSANNEES